MRIKRVEVRNFKSFNDLKIDLGKFNVVIGANASGKSNFVSIFKFLRDITTSGLENAISLQGGVAYLRNMNMGASEDLAIKIISDKKFGMGQRTKMGLVGLKIYEVIYEFKLSFHKRGAGFRIATDTLIQKVEFYDRKKELLKVETFANYKKLQGVYRIGQITMKNVQNDKSTILVWHDEKIKNGLKAKDFHKRYLKK